MLNYFYGLVDAKQLVAIVYAVCDVLGGGKGDLAIRLLLETAAQETLLGRYKDPTPSSAGRGVFQIDPIAFADVQARVRVGDVEAIKARCNFDVRTLRHEVLDVSPLASAVFARLFYKFIPEPIPTSVDGRAAYWKRFYNTPSGAGLPAQYVERAKLLDGLVA